MPLPIPQPDVVGEPSLYMPLEEAKLKELTQEHQPSLIASSQRIVNSAASKQNDKLPHPRAQHVSSQDVRNKTITRAFAKGFVKCGNFGKPRVINVLRHRPREIGSVYCQRENSNL